MDGNLEQSTRDFQQSLAINPHFAEAMANLGFVESLRGNQAAAEVWYRKGVAADPTFPRVYRRLGDLYYERGDFARAYGYYQQTTRILPSDVRATVQAGNCARRLGRTAEANALFDRAERLRPEGWVPTYNRACLLATTGQPQAALKTLETLAARHPLSFELIERDTDLASVRALPDYATLRRMLRDDAEDDDVAEDAG
jgi:tetratricopeptide (TPR) repeat protein